MNIFKNFKKIKLVNKGLKIAKEIKEYLNSTHIDKEMKEIITSLQKDIEKLIKKFPELKDVYLDILEIIK